MEGPEDRCGTAEFAVALRIMQQQGRFPAIDAQAAAIRFQSMKLRVPQ
ncbi:hypothetical protein [Nocardia sp. NPDC051570]